MTNPPRAWRRRFAATVLQSEAPARQMAWGAGVGMFLALLPIVGQLYLLPPAWAGARYLLRRTFHLPAAYAMVLIINPPVKILTFYLYLVTGEWLLGGSLRGGFEDFRVALHGADGNWITNSVQAVAVALERFGWPIAVGGVVWSVMGGTAAFALAWGLVTYTRRRGARTPAAAVTVEPR